MTIVYHIQQSVLRRALEEYSYALYEKFGDIPCTPAAIAIMDDYLAMYQRSKQLQESNSVWKVKIKLVVDNHRPCVIIDNDASDMIVDVIYS